MKYHIVIIDLRRPISSYYVSTKYWHMISTYLSIYSVGVFFLIPILVLLMAWYFAIIIVNRLPGWLAQEVQTCHNFWLIPVSLLPFFLEEDWQPVFMVSAMVCLKTFNYKMLEQKRRQQ